MADNLYDVIIIGGGPAGLTAALYAARVKLGTVVIDKSSAAGALAYADRIENYPGLKEALSGPELLNNMRSQAVKAGAEYREDLVTGVKLDSDIKEVYGMTADTCFGKTVIIATGAMGRKPSIPGEEPYLGRGVSYCAICDASFFLDKTVCVIGNSEEALKEADVLSRFAEKVYIIGHSKNFSVPADHQFSSPKKIQVMEGTFVTSIEGDSLVRNVRIRNMHTDEVSEQPVDGVFIYLSGNRPVIDFLGSTVKLTEKQCVFTHRSAETSVEGVYAAGDVTCSEIRQVVVAASSGCTAALTAEKYIHHRIRTRFEWSKK